MTKKDRYQRQLNLWVVGQSEHNYVDNLCCPDFSCCRGIETIAPRETREAFIRASEDVKMEFLASFLAAALGNRAYICGTTPSKEPS